MDASRTSINISHGSHRRRNVKSANHFQIILPIKREVFFWFVFNLEHLIILLFCFKRVQSAMLYPAIPSVPNSNNPTVLET